MEKKDHISLILTPEDVAGGGVASNLLSSRKSLRRSWNQLPRCQRNLIILGISAVCVTLLLFLPGDQIVSYGNNEDFSAAGGSQSAPLLSLRGKESKDGGLAAPRNSRSNIEDDQDDARDKEKSDEDEILEKNGLDDYKKLNSDQHARNVENALNGDGQDDQDVVGEDINKIKIEEIDLNDPVKPLQEVNVDVFADARTVLEAAVQEPEKLPGSNGKTIEDFLRHLETSTDAQKQHFHGATNERQSAVVAALKHSWNGYKKFAWGHDNLKPISQSAHDWFGLGLTIVDSLDTLYIMGLEDEFLEARDWVENHLSFDVNNDINLFEVTIRVLGGLLASYHLSGDKIFLKKSVELGNRLLPCFLSPSGIPYSDVNLASMSAHSPKWSPDSSTSEVTTLQLEFRDLSRSTNISIYEKVVQIVNEKVHTLEKNNGLVPIFINANTGTFRNYATISLGARGDSYYEYLLKQWIQTGCKENDFLILDYMRAIDGVLTQLRRRTPKEKHVYIGELINGKDFKPKMDHLTCYLPGTLLLGHKYGMPDSHLLLARDLLDTCYQTYVKQPTQLAAEITYFAVNDNENEEIYVKPNDAHNLLRPEFIESLYYFYAITGNRTYQDMGWTIFQAFEKHTKVANGYTSIGNVKNIFNTRLRNMMESFWLGETLKYFYLLFSDNRKEVDLEKWVFNTEAHPLPIRAN